LQYISVMVSELHSKLLNTCIAQETPALECMNGLQ